MTQPEKVKSRPARGGSPNDLRTGKTSGHGTGTDVETARRVDPRTLVRDVRMLTLVDALFGDEPFGLLDDGAGDVWFICPRCGHRTHNGGTARPIDAWSWHCWRCQWDGTRMHLEILVLKSRVAVDRLFRLVNEDAR